jgi:tRNA G10  N-methylase Trm11
MKFLLFCGAGNSLAENEVKARLGSTEEIIPNTFLLNLPTEAEAKVKAEMLGSSIKLAVLCENVSTNLESVADLITSKNFSVTNIGENSSNQSQNQEIKEILGKGRFILGSDAYGLSPIHQTKHKVDEFFLDLKNDQVWKTIWVHNYNHWIKKDRFMPHVNAKAGMLPPKIARSMINLAPDSVWGEGKTLADPFCGSGRVLVEGGELGFNLIGADILKTQCDETSDNLRSLRMEAEIVCMDSTHLSQRFQNKIDLIVTEPFMGKPNLRPDKIKFLVPGLEKLYLGCLKDWYASLRPKGVIVMVFPWFNDGKKDYKTSKIIDGKLALSYNQLNQGILYSRPGATVKREIIVLQKK